MPVFTDNRTRISVSIPDGWLTKREGFPPQRLTGDADAVIIRSPDDIFRLNITVGNTLGIDTPEENRRLFQEYYAGSILKEGTIIVDGVEHFAGVYSKWGLIHKRYVIIKGGKEYAMACAARLETLDEFEKSAEPVFDNIVLSLKFL